MVVDVVVVVVIVVGVAAAAAVAVLVFLQTYSMEASKLLLQQLTPQLPLVAFAKDPSMELSFFAFPVAYSDRLPHHLPFQHCAVDA